MGQYAYGVRHVQYKYAEEIAALTNILMRVFRGDSYQVVPKLRKIIEKLEVKGR